MKSSKKAIKSSIKRKKINDFVSHYLVPKLKQVNVVVMDNLNIHKIEGIEKLITATGARVEYLPPYLLTRL